MGQIVGCAHIALLCVQEDPEDRPSMWDVVLMLHGGVAALSALPTPKQPARRYGGGREQRPKFREVLANGHDWDKKTVTVLMRQHCLVLHSPHGSVEKVDVGSDSPQ
ncbi:Os06g0541500 [Oryza sativa Japonica Group]|uniref:Os06g0541500 protein n=1 Tax=Oryza sativa subsp. japonica TaxID=39947 RepID=C7J3C0_ORYSJ|nr:Os06g0541500 [Oryza sativa Japonica Group]|eukprot:NP_001174839.1 Os06g0541500 [Oryza sativa Japonica Group]